MTSTMIVIFVRKDRYYLTGRPRKKDTVNTLTLVHWLITGHDAQMDGAEAAMNLKKLASWTWQAPTVA